MNEKELAEIEERAAKATEGRWIFQKAWATSDILDDTGADIASNVERRNADFVAHARQDVPALVEEVRRLNAENARLRAALCFYSNDSTYSMSIIDKDRGQIAKNALKGGEQ